LAVNITAILSMLLSQAPLVVIAILVLIIYFERRLSSIDQRFNMLASSIDRRFDMMERRLDVIEDRLLSVINFNEALLSILLSRGTLLETEYKALLLALPRVKIPGGSQYYTREVEERLFSIIDRLTNDPKTATWDDVLELERIYDIIWDEIEVTRDRKRRRALVQLSVTVKVMAIMTKAYLIGRGIMPPWVKGRS
jgi:hypothetical protein